MHPKLQQPDPNRGKPGPGAYNTDEPTFKPMYLPVTSQDKLTSKAGIYEAALTRHLTNNNCEIENAPILSTDKMKISNLTAPIST